MRHVFLSPHPDDAIWSCGGFMAELGREKAIVKLITFFDGDAATEFTPHTLPLDAQGRQDTLPRLRRREDKGAAELLKIDRISLKLPDAALRRANDQWLYPTPRSLKHCHPHCFSVFLPLMLDQLHPIIHPEDIVYGPLGQTSHADHILVRRAFDRVDCHKKYLYPEFPYGASGDFAPDQDIINHPVDFDIWFRAASCYESQIKKYFRTRDRFEYRLRLFAASRTDRHKSQPPEEYVCRLMSANAAT